MPGEETRELIQGDIEAALAAQGFWANVPWARVFAIVGPLAAGLGGTLGMNQYNANSMTAVQETCADKVIQQNEACHEFIRNCMELIGDRP